MADDESVRTAQHGSRGLDPATAASCYRRSLLAIRVPVSVTLASKKVSIQEVLELGPGAIFKFDRSCDDPLELSVGDRIVANGEVVKVGDKFGLTIREILPPQERFVPIRKLS